MDHSLTFPSYVISGCHMSSAQEQNLGVQYGAEKSCMTSTRAVSYTHLDVYKRQELYTYF